MPDDLQVDHDLLTNPLLAGGPDYTGVNVVGSIPIPGEGLPNILSLTGRARQPADIIARAQMTWGQFAPLMQRLESGGQNVPNYLFGPGRTASGVNQITNSTWNRYAEAVGAPKLEWPQTAMDRPLEEQNKVGEAIYNAEGVGPWANYNPQLANALGMSIGGRGLPQQTVGGGGAPLPNELFQPVVAANALEAPLPQTAVSAGQQFTTPAGPNLLTVMGILRTLMAGTHSFTPVDYDPWAAVRRQG